MLHSVVKLKYILQIYTAWIMERFQRVAIVISLLLLLLLMTTNFPFRMISMAVFALSLNVHCYLNVTPFL